MKTSWPTLSYAEAKETYKTLHLWTQIIGKIKLAKQPWINHSWHITLFVTPTGLTTADIPDDEQHFQADFNFIRHQLEIKTSEGQVRSFRLEGLSVADFYAKVMGSLRELKIEANINLIPNEMEEVIPFDQDHIHATYTPEHAAALHQALLQAQDVLSQFRAEFKGKCSPVHFFWGSFDLAVSRFSGREAPQHPGGVPHLPDWVAQEAYSHEVCSCGFWPGNEAVPFAAFYSYIYPAPEGFERASVQPDKAYYHQELGEFILPYEAVQQAQDPSSTLLAFLRSTYEAAAELGQWDRKSLEKSVPT
ncbi:hypothetical protein CLV24_101392 [Pontibacter ummariensis]|uniref:Ava_C0101 and related proteins n=1 Tax=Pontibacter ummariensis TaxID=1610492 RepID=A0A239BGZ9_9BACT|nr:DUF5996 family protein [Pontibacter ummariensis]PRY16545.1 hypothetical protein CLV24_101392 [Pontibacter ummariensis]SNS07076.1 hypothetical protein SAMN06296052_101392 [Pontibacter ummariensis]